MTGHSLNSYEKFVIYDARTNFTYEALGAAVIRAIEADKVIEFVQTSATAPASGSWAAGARAHVQAPAAAAAPGFIYVAAWKAEAAIAA
jgi:hypothetical protein